MTSLETEFFAFRRLGPLSVRFQIVTIILLYIIITLLYYAQYKTTGLMAGYPPSVSLLFVPIYEELLFRGVLLGYLKKHLPPIKAGAAVSVLFGLWHLKNIFWIDGRAVARQIFYTSLVFSPILCWLTLRTRTLWPGVILHYLNNICTLL